MRHSLLFFFRTRTGFANHSGWKTSLMKPAASSLVISALMASRRSCAKRRSRCFLGLAVGSTLRLCSIRLLGTPGISDGFHANMSRFSCRNVMSASSYLSSSPEPIRAVFEGSPVPRSMVLRTTSSLSWLINGRDGVVWPPLPGVLGSLVLRLIFLLLPFHLVGAALAVVLPVLLVGPVGSFVLQHVHIRDVDAAELTSVNFAPEAVDVGLDHLLVSDVDDGRSRLKEAPVVAPKRLI